MKSNHGMNKLRNKIVWCFVIIVFTVRVIDSIIDSIWDTLIVPRIYPSGEYAGKYDIYTLGYMGMSILLYVLSAIVFYKLTKKAIEKESIRQVKEQNLLYAAIAHDLKTPMTSVQGFAKALSEGRIRPNEMKEISDIIYQKSNSMNELVDTLFEYAKYGTKKYVLNITDIDICVFVRDLIAEHYCDFEEHGIALEVEIPDTPIILKVDKTELKRAFSNLIINTYKHNPKGINVYLTIEKKDDRCVVTIADTGSEIPKEMNVFQPFVTENVARTAGQGTGLGLAITKRIIDSHYAQIYIDRNYEGYTKAFIVEFPMNQKIQVGERK